MPSWVKRLRPAQKEHLRTAFALRIINAFFVRAADDFVDGGRGFDVVSFEEGRDE
jgi:hypothetical protein